MAVALLFLLTCLGPKVHRELAPRSPLPEVQVPTGLSDISAETCGACHVAIYDEWSGSMMAKAWTDPVFQADFQQRGELYVCRNCHTPLTEQQPELTLSVDRVIPELETTTAPNPAFVPQLMDEGVTCAACHVREGRVMGPHAEVDPPNAWGHDPEFATAATCERCHQMPPPPFWKLERDIADTHREMERWQAATGSSDDCVTCHMPEVERPLMAGYPSRPGRRHTFAGSWDAEMMASAARLERDGDVVEVHNLAGHNLPSTEPTHALELVWLDGDRVVETERWERVIVDRKERSDTTLAPGEVRVLPVVAGATSVELRFLRLDTMPQVVQDAIPDEHRTVLLASLPLR